MKDFGCAKCEQLWLLEVVWRRTRYYKTSSMPSLGFRRVGGESI